jgi:hypothetical protein
VLPRALFQGTVMVMFAYVFTDVAYRAIVPMREIVAVPENRVAQHVAAILFGRVGSMLVIVVGIPVYLTWKAQRLS